MYVWARCDSVVGMSGHTCEKLSMITMAMLCVLVASVPTVAESLSINIDVDGDLDAQLHGLMFSATIEGDVDLVGNVPCDEDMIWFSAAGSIFGVGFYSLLELTTNGWILMKVYGSTADERAIDIRSLLYSSRQNVIPLKAGDLFEGVHHTVIQIGESADVYWGEFSGTLVGGLAPAETEGTIRLTGRGSFYLAGERVPGASSVNFPETIPLDDPDLPDAYLQIINRFFNPRIEQEPRPV